MCFLLCLLFQIRLSMFCLCVCSLCLKGVGYCWNPWHRRPKHRWFARLPCREDMTPRPKLLFLLWTLEERMKSKFCRLLPPLPPLACRTASGLSHAPHTSSSTLALLPAACSSVLSWFWRGLFPPWHVDTLTTARNFSYAPFTELPPVPMDWED